MDVIYISLKNLCNIVFSVYLLPNALLQAEFQNVIDSVSRFGKPSCLSASIAWNPRRGESQQSSFVLGYNSDLSQYNSPKVCFAKYNLEHIFLVENNNRHIRNGYLFNYRQM